MDWLLLRGLLNARLYPHKIKVKSSRLNVKALMQAGSYIGFIFFAFYLIVSPARSRPIDPLSVDGPDYLSTAEMLVTQTHLATFTPFTPTVTGTSTSTPGVTSTSFLSFPYVTHLGEFYFLEHIFLFSYYYPDLGGVNCHWDNWVNGRCKDVTASGMSWRKNMGKALAVHPDMLATLPYGSIIKVVEPVAIAGEYMVIDLCGGCNINGYYYFDFLFDKMPVGMNWSDPVKFQVARVGFLNLFATPTLTPVYDYLPTWTSTPTQFEVSLVPDISTLTVVPTATEVIIPTVTEIIVPTATQEVSP